MLSNSRFGKKMLGRLLRQQRNIHGELAAGAMNNSDFVANTSQRCYYCKKKGFLAVAVWAEERGYGLAAQEKMRGFTYITLDLRGYRIGSKNEMLDEV